MDSQTIQVIYQLWNHNEILARKVVHDVSLYPSVRALAYYLLNDKHNFKKLYDYHTDKSLKEDDYWLEIRLMVEHWDCHMPVDVLKERAEYLASLGDYFIFSRMMLATIAAQQGDYKKSISMYEAILSITPLNLSALVSLTGIYLFNRQIDYARNTLQRALEATSNMTGLQKVYWQVGLFTYGLRVYFERIVFVTVFMFIVGILPIPISWMVFVVTVSVFLSLASWFHTRKNTWAFSILIRFIFSMLIAWLTGYGIKFLFLVLEGM